MENNHSNIELLRAVGGKSQKLDFAFNTTIWNHEFFSRFSDLPYKKTVKITWRLSGDLNP